MPRYCVQRESRRLKRASLLSEAAAALNALSIARAGVPLVLERLPAAKPQATTSAAQRSIFNRLGRRIAACCAPLPDLSSDETLMELLHTRDMYELGENTVREELDLSRLRVVNKSAQPKPAENLAPPHILPLLLEPGRFIVRSDSELAALADGPRSDRTGIRVWFIRLPRCGGSCTRPTKSIGLLGFRSTSCQGFAPAFFIRKKDGNQRVIIDGRHANACHREPPKSLLAHPFCVCPRLCGNALPSQHATPAERPPAEVCPPPCVYGASVDIIDGFYQFLTQSVASWFCFDVGVTAEEFGVSEIWDDVTRAMVPVRSTRHPSLSRLPWHADGLEVGTVYICHSVIEDVVRRSRFAGDGAVS